MPRFNVKKMEAFSGGQRLGRIRYLHPCRGFTLRPPLDPLFQSRKNLVTGNGGTIVIKVLGNLPAKQLFLQVRNPLLGFRQQGLMFRP